MGYAHQVFTNISQTMNRATENISTSSYLTNNSSWLFEETKVSNWTHEENKLFENALALFDRDTPDRWYNVAAMIPGKTVSDVMKQYRELEDDVSDIEAGLIPVPGYDDSSSFTLDWVANNQQGFDGSNQFYTCGAGKRGFSARVPDQERKKGVPWTVEEHRQFLMGLKKYGKGDWRNISRNFVTTRTPTQVASHAQKYFIRQLSGGKDKRRSSIHDITTVNLGGNKSFSPDDNTTSSPDRCSTVTQNMDNVAEAMHHWNPTGSTVAFDLQSNNLKMGNTCGTSSYGYNKLQEQSLERGSQFGAYSSNFYQMHPIQYQ